MQYTKLGNSDLNVSRICMGCMGFGWQTESRVLPLKSVNSKIKSTQSQLKDVEKLLKLDPGNTISTAIPTFF